MRYLINILLLIVSINAYAQQDSITSKDNHLFVNKKLPLYLYLSSSDDLNAEAVQLKGVQNDKYTNPFYFDTKGKNTIFVNYPVKIKTDSRYKYINKLVYPSMSDGMSPRTRFKLKHAKVKYQKGKPYYKSGLVVQILSIDYISGVKNIYYSIDGEDYKPYTAELKFDKAGTYNLRFYAEDNVGNIEKEKKLEVNIY